MTTQGEAANGRGDRRVLEGALLERTAVAQVSDAAVIARYKRDFAGQPTVEEVHARHILVGTEEEAKRIIGELNKGSDFAALAQRFSKDPDKARGGDLGFFRHDQVWKGFADLAFSLKPGEIAQMPIFNEFGWHVVQTLERRPVPPPTLDQVRDAIRKQLLQEAVQSVVAQAREGCVCTSSTWTGRRCRVRRRSRRTGPEWVAEPGDEQSAGGPDAGRGLDPGHGADITRRIARGTAKSRELITTRRGLLAL